MTSPTSLTILALESSCDETAAAILRTPLNPKTNPFSAKPQLLSSVVVSQIDIFKAYGGVIPEVAARSHLEAILPVIHQAFREAGLTTTSRVDFCQEGIVFKEAGVADRGALTVRQGSNASADAEDGAFSAKPFINNPTLDWSQIDAIAVTHTPGLLGSLLIGTLTARVLAILHDKPLYPIHHLKSHIYSAWLPPLKTSSTLPSRLPISTPPSQLPISTPTPTLPTQNPVDFCREGTVFKEAGVADRGALTARRQLKEAREEKVPAFSSEATLRCPAPCAGGSNASADAEDGAFSAKPSFPLIALVVSGGHTQLIHMPNHNSFRIIGTTRDDAVGECFDKVAKILGLPYPGGPAITAAASGQIPPESLAQYKTSTPPRPGDPHKYLLPHPKLTHINHVDFCREDTVFKEAGVADRGALTVRRQLKEAREEKVPAFSSEATLRCPAPCAGGSNASADAEGGAFSAKPPINNTTLDFSFSGLKTATLRLVQKIAQKPLSFPSHDLAPLLTPQQVADLAASFQLTAVEILLKNLEKAAAEYIFTPNAIPSSTPKTPKSTPDSPPTPKTPTPKSPINSLVIAGGVSANPLLRQKACALSQKLQIPVFFPTPEFSGDNAAMVAIAALYEILTPAEKSPSSITSAISSAPADRVDAKQSPILTPTSEPSPITPTLTPPTDPYKLNIYPRSPIS